MPSEKTMPKLTDEQRRQVVAWLAEGLRDGEVIERLQTECGIAIKKQSVAYYRTAYAEQIAEAYEDAMKTAATQGLCNRIRRLEVLERNAQKLIDATSVSGRGYTQVNAELRATLKDIRDELGDLKTRAELTGPGGGAVQVEAWWKGIEKIQDEEQAKRDGGDGE